MEFTIDTVVPSEAGNTIQPTKIVLQETHIEIYLDLKYSSRIKERTGDDILDKVAPTYSTIKGAIKEAVFMDKLSITSFAASEEEDAGITKGLLSLESASTTMLLVFKSYDEAYSVLQRLIHWRYAS